MNKKLTILVILIFSAIATFAQNKTIPNSYIILNNKSPEKEAFYKKSIEAADMEQYRLRSQRSRLTFENGFEIELLSAKELFLKNQTVNINNYEVALPKGAAFPIFNVLDSGYLTAKVETHSKQ